MNIRTAALGVAIAGLVVGCGTAATVAGSPKPAQKSAAAHHVTVSRLARSCRELALFFTPPYPARDFTAAHQDAQGTPLAAELRIVDSNGGNSTGTAAMERAQQICAPYTSLPAAGTHVAAPARPAQGGCDPALWRHVYSPDRLHVVSACMTVTGTVEEVRQEPDGDLHILLKPDDPSLVNAVNASDEHGDLVLEPVCAGPVSQADAVAACQGFTSGVSIPATGSRVQVTGSYVLDADHGWMEIHPVSRITVIGSQPAPVPSSAPPTTAPAAPPTTAPAAPPTTAPAAAGCHPLTSGGNCYEPGEFCPKADHGETGVAGDGKAITCTDVNGIWRWED
jgi:hypothetical protein